ncbi:MAG: response regulator [Saprospiraceae bacterium]|nr:response regulator [Saprospiraceae bacterium]
MRNYLKLLVIDDEKDICQLLKRMLSKYYEEIQIGHTLEDAMRLLKEHNPDHLLLDNNLPDGEGVKIIKTCKAFSPELKVIVFSAMDIHEEAITSGADSFISKPIYLPNLLRALQAKTALR